MVKKVLIVDDSKFMRMVLRDIIDATGDFKVIGDVDDGSKVLGAYKMHKPDIITMDVVMPTSGIDAVKEVKKFDPKVKIVMITAMGDQERLMNETIEAGAEKRYITKPFKQDEIREGLKNL